VTTGSLLDATSGSTAFSAGPARILGNDRYARRVELDADTLDSLARAWLRAHRLGPALPVERFPDVTTDLARVA